MTNSAKPGPLGSHHPHRHHRHTANVPPKAHPPARTPGTAGHLDQGDPTLTTLLGWTPNLTGFRDWADNTLHSFEDWAMHTLGSIGVEKKTGTPVAVGSPPAAAAVGLDLSFLGTYAGGTIGKGDIESAARDIGCEPGLVYAIAKQESGGAPFTDIGGRMCPTILYERHIFRNLTRPNRHSPSPYETDHHDICGPQYHYTKKHTTKGADHKKIVTMIDTTTHQAAVAADVYGPGGLNQYQKLLKACALDKDKALQSCSWGKYQMMGMNYKAGGFSDVFAFVKAMSTGEQAHLKVLVSFIKSNKALRDGMKNKDYEAIAAGYNGGGWRTSNPDYATNIEAYSKEY